jgi:Ca2+-binding EF-hand superfamily protein
VTIGKRALLSLCLLTALATGTAFSADSVGSSDTPDDAAAAADPSDIQDLLILGPTHPLVIRVHIATNGVPFRKVWRSAIETSFNRFDAAKTGRITAEQANRLFAVFTRAALPDAPVSGEKSAGAMAMSKPRTFTLDEVLAQLEQTAPPFTVRHRLASHGAGPALFSLLDTDGDGRLSREELNAAEANLRCRDFDDDGLITAEELVLGPARSADGEKQAGGNGVKIDGPVIALGIGTPLEKLVDILLFRYDRNRDGRLSIGSAAAEVRSPNNSFAKFDLDHDQSLDRAELSAFLQAPPVIEMTFQFGSKFSRSLVTDRTSADAAAAYQLSHKVSDGGYRLVVAENQLNFGRNNRDPAQSNQLPDFTDYDQNKDGFLSAEELNASGMMANFALMDADGDGKITPKEFDDFIQWQANVASSQLVLEVTDEGQDLFSLLDRNNDGFLSPRELKTAAEILKTEDADHDGFLTASDIPYRVKLELSRGGPNTTANAAVAATSSRKPLRSKSGTTPPEWFLKMDRNGDGDISPAEFLGTREQFDKLDLNKDGLIDAEEAAAAGK